MADFAFDQYAINPRLTEWLKGGGTGGSPDRRLMDGPRSAPTDPMARTNPGTSGPTAPAPTQTAPAPTQSGGGAPGASPQAQQFIRDWQASHPPTRESYLGLIDAMKAAGFPVERPTHAGGTLPSDDKISVGGQIIDILPNVDGNGNATSWGFNMSPDDWWINGQPASDAFGAPPRSDGGDGPGGMGGDPMNSPLLKPYGEFTPTDPNKIADTPAFKFRMDQGLNALERSSAARGTSLTGGTLKDLTEFAQGLASTEFGAQWNRDLQGYTTNRDTSWGNQDRAYDKLSDFTKTGLAGANTVNNSSSGYGDNTQANTDRQSDLETGQGDANAASQLAKQRASNDAGAAVANTIGAIDWSKFMKRRVDPVRGATPRPGE
jgi:hypothetical protein